MLNPIQAIAIDWRYLEPQNLLLIILILATVGTSSLLVYYFERRNIPRLVFGYIWKQNDRIIPTAINYFLKIKRENGEGGVQGFRGFVGVKDKFDPKVSHLLLSKNSEIFLYDYLVHFKVFEHNGNKVITFLGVEYSSNETLQHLKMLSLMNIKNVN